MRISNGLLQYLRRATETPLHSFNPNLTKTRRCVYQQRSSHSLLLKSSRRTPRSLQNASSRRYQHNPADDPEWKSILDRPPQVVKVNSRSRGFGVYVLAAIPITAFLLGTWQVQRLGWKTDLIARFEDRLVQPPLPLPPTVDPTVIHEFDYRRVYATGRYRHDQEMLIGPRLRDGADGYLVITPLERDGGTKILVNRGWIAKEKRNSPERRQHGQPSGEVSVQGLLREPWTKNYFTPDNNPEKGEWYFPDVEAMAKASGSTPVWIEATMQPDLYVAWDREGKGIPIGRPAEVNLRNNHTQYIFTWYSLSLATTIMFWMVVKRPPRGGSARVRRNVEW